MSEHWKTASLPTNKVIGSGFDTNTGGYNSKKAMNKFDRVLGGSNFDLYKLEHGPQHFYLILQRRCR